MFEIVPPGKPMPFEIWGLGLKTGRPFRMGTYSSLRVALLWAEHDRNRITVWIESGYAPAHWQFRA